MYPAVSFIVPIYNTEPYLPDCLESILNQSISKEIILIDDGSTDNSLLIALEYSKKYDFITIIHNQNKGQSNARNKGLKIAQGEYIYFVDSDDYLIGDQLKYIYLTARKYDIDVVKLQAQQQIEQNNLKSDIYLIHPATKNIEPDKGIILNATDFLKNIVKNWIPAICWSMIKRDFLEKNQLYFVENVKAEDQLFYIQLLTCSQDMRVLEIGNIIYHYRLRPNSTVTSPNPQYFLDHFIICELIKNWVNERHLSSEIIQCLNIIIARIYQSALVIYSNFDELQKVNYQSYIRSDIIQYINDYLD